MHGRQGQNIYALHLDLVLESQLSDLEKGGRKGSGSGCVALSATIQRIRGKRSSSKRTVVHLLSRADNDRYGPVRVHVAGDEGGDIVCLWTAVRKLFKGITTH